MQQSWRRKGVAAALAVATAAFGAVATSPGALAEGEAAPSLDDVNTLEASDPTVESLYVVQMNGQPVVAYDGSIAGLAATRPAKGQKINPNSKKVAKYAEYLDSTHAALAASVSGELVYNYRYSFNGFAVRMSELDAIKLRGNPEVAAVTKNEMLQLDTSDTPDFLGLDGDGGVWETLGGPTGGKKGDGAGEDVIIGIVDSGIWPESPSFSDRDADGKRVYSQIPGWHGKCVPGEAFPASSCNQKLIGAQYFNAGYGGNAGVDQSFEGAYEFNSPRDADGHGTHTASTAGGNYGVESGQSVAGIPVDPVSGIAPRARLAVYKACWGISPDGGCPTVDTVAAIDQAVADGVDVINYSISGSTNDYMNPVEIAFLFAADAGVFVAASAGNDGPDAETLNHPSPWITTVAASTHGRVAVGSGWLGEPLAEGEAGDAVFLEGASAAASGTGTLDLVYSADVGLADADADEARLCYPGTLDPALVDGKLVACDRGVIARVDKSLAVSQAGGLGMFLMNVTPSSLNADAHSVPTLHVDEAYREIILDYIATVDGPQGSVNQAEVSFDNDPELASFSSRGPILGGVEDVLKPDITAPGVDILAAVSPYSSAGGVDYDFYSGTSMSSPHIAGIAALMADAHPDWSPMAIKSALMTTAYQENVTAEGAPADVFDFGAGHVDPAPALNPGLVYEAGWTDWLGFLCGTGQLAASYCPSIEIDPSDLNQPSIAIGSLAGTQTITRTVTNVGPAGTYVASVDEPNGVSVSVEPAELSLATGESATFTVTFQTVGVDALEVYGSGALTWTSGDTSVRTPIAVRPVAVSAPASVSFDPDSVPAGGVSGSVSYEVGFGFTGDFSATAIGLAKGEEQVDTIVDDPTNDFATAYSSDGMVGVNLHEFTYPAGTPLARLQLFDDFTAGADDLDLYVFFDFSGDGIYQLDEFLAGSGSGTSAEVVDIGLGVPFDATLGVFVHGWQTDGGAPTDYKLFSFGVPPANAGNVTIDAPAGGMQGETGTVTADFGAPTLLEADAKYFGIVSYEVAGIPAGDSTYLAADTYIQPVIGSGG